MRVIIIGGAGVFGSRLAAMLVRDGCDVVLAGRRSPDDLAAKMGASAIAVDRSGDLAALWALAPDMVIDAAGPFHAYGDDPYRLPRAAIAQGVHYLDLADDADFCAGIAALDTAAKQAGVVALSGASSVPALSSAIVADLAKGADTVDTVTTAILPGNKAPRGKAVVESILHQTGTGIDVMVDGEVMSVRSWSAPRVFDLGHGVRRRGYAIRVPDQRLLPAFFGARTVQFYAGLELGVMGHGLAVWSWLRGALRLGNPAWLRTSVQRAAALLDRFGTDTGGMQVDVVTRTGPVWQRHQWNLIVRNGDGPSIPGVAARAIVRTIADQPRGAGPALARFSRAVAQDAMADLATDCRVEVMTLTPLFQRVLGADFDKLAQPVRDSHATYGPRRWVGSGSVTRGAGVWPRLIAAVFRFPKATDSIPVTVIKTPKGDGELWQRNFGGQVFESFLRQEPQGMSERFSPFTFELGLHEKDGALHFPVKTGRIGWLPIPRMFLPQSIAREHADGGNFCFDVALYAPVSGQMIVHYQGTLARPAGAMGQVLET